MCLDAPVRPLCTQTTTAGLSTVTRKPDWALRRGDTGRVHRIRTLRRHRTKERPFTPTHTRMRVRSHARSHTRTRTHAHTHSCRRHQATDPSSSCPPPLELASCPSGKPHMHIHTRTRTHARTHTRKHMQLARACHAPRTPTVTAGRASAFARPAKPDYQRATWTFATRPVVVHTGAAPHDTWGGRCATLTHTHMHIRTHAHACVRSRAHTHSRARMHTHTLTHTHTHTGDCRVCSRD